MSGKCLLLQLTVALTRLLNLQMSLFENFVITSRLAERALAMSRSDARRLNRIHFSDGSFVPATEAGFANFFEQFPSYSHHDPSFLARY